MRFLRPVLSCTSVALLLSACGGGSTSATSPTAGAAVVAVTETYGHHAPAISSLVPAAATAHSAAFTLTVNGSRFETSSVVMWNGIALPTTYVDYSKLTAYVTAAAVAASGSASITVAGPAPRGSSTAVIFDITAANPVPAISALVPTGVTAGSAAFTLTVDGTGFVSGSYVVFEGIVIPTTFVSDAQLTAAVPAAQVVGAGSASVTVDSPVPGGGVSNASAFAINGTNPAPVLTVLAPASATAGGALFTLTVTGSGFVPASKVEWNGTALSTTYVSATSLTASVPAADIASGASDKVTVVTPAPGGGTSASASFTVNSANPVPAISSLAPASAAAGAAGLKLTVDGSGFVAASTVDWNGTALATTYVNDAQLTATLPTADLAAAGTGSVTVHSPTPGGGASGASTFTITATNPAPTISSLSPTTATAGGAASTLTVNGGDFIASSSVMWNATALATTYVSASKLTAQLPASAIASAGTASVTAKNPTPGGGTSSAQTFTVTSANALPVIASLAPATATAGGAAFTLTINGTGFVSTSKVDWNGTALPTTFVSDKQLTAAVTASDTSGVASDSVTVVSPAPGGGTSVASTFTATSAVTTACAQDAASLLLATIATNASDAYTSDTVANNTCSVDTTYGKVQGVCYSPYAIQVNAYGTPPSSLTFSMWANSQSCWGFTVDEASDSNNVYWNGPTATRGFSFGVNGKLTSTGGILVSALDAQYASATTHCPTTGTAESVCAKWSMNVPGAEPQSAANTSTTTYTKWDALVDIYFHAVAAPTKGESTSFDLQIYQMIGDFEVGGVSNWGSYIVAKHTTKTIGGVQYLVSVNMENPGTEGSAWVGSGGTLDCVSMVPLPTYPTSPEGSGSFLWGSPSVLHDVGGIIAWLSQTQTINGVTGIFDDNGVLLYDNVRKANVTTPLISPNYYLTGLNPGFEVVLANPGTSGTSTYYPNNTVFTTTDLWIALPGEAVGN